MKKKTSFAIRKNVFSFLLLFGCSFGFAYKKNEKKNKFCNSKKRIFFPALVWLLLWLCIDEK
jgi:hypothetical protein